jgi:hypothetical protein
MHGRRIFYRGALRAGERRAWQKEFGGKQFAAQYPQSMKASAFLILPLTAAILPLHAKEVVTFTSLNPSTASASAVLGGAGIQQVGRATIGTDLHGILWNSSASSFVDLHPAGAVSSLVFATNGSKQAGEIFTATNVHAALWSGTAASFLDLNPAGATDSAIRSIAGNQQVGDAKVGGNTKAAVWAGTAASYTDLTPAAATEGTLWSTTGLQQAGQATIGGVRHAGLWSGSAGSFVDVHPSSYSESAIYGTTGTQQVGFASISGKSHAGLWTGTAASFVDLHPSGATESQANSTMDTRQAGSANFSGNSHAAVWSGTAASFVDLQSFMPAAYTSSSVRSILKVGDHILVAGYAFNATLARTEAVLWEITDVPAPIVRIAGRKSLITTNNRLKIHGTASGSVTSVSYKIGKKTRAAKGATKWSFIARLKPGRNVIFITATGPGGDSAAKRLVVRRVKP